MFAPQCILFFVLFHLVSCGRIDAIMSRSEKQLTVRESTERPHINIITDNIVPSVNEDHIKVLQMDKGTMYDKKNIGKPEMIRKMGEKLHAVNATDFNENENTTEIHPESTSHSHIYERTARTKTTVYRTKKDKKATTTTTEGTVHHSRSKRSFTKDEMESFSEMGKVFTESFKKFNDDAEKAQKDFMSLMKKLDDISQSHDKASN